MILSVSCYLNYFAPKYGFSWTIGLAMLEMAEERAYPTIHLLLLVVTELLELEDLKVKHPLKLIFYILTAWNGENHNKTRLSYDYNAGV